jgi:hypothetical protein
MRNPDSLLAKVSGFRVVVRDRFGDLVLHSVNTVTDSLAVTPAKAGVQSSLKDLDSRFRGNDEESSRIPKCVTDSEMERLEVRREHDPLEQSA